MYVKTKNAILVFLANRHHSLSSSTCGRSHPLSLIWLRVGRVPLCLSPCLPFDLSSMWRGVLWSRVSHQVILSQDRTLDERYIKTKIPLWQTPLQDRGGLISS